MSAHRTVRLPAPINEAFEIMVRRWKQMAEIKSPNAALVGIIAEVCTEHHAPRPMAAQITAMLPAERDLIFEFILFCVVNSIPIELPCRPPRARDLLALARRWWDGKEFRRPPF
jgi:hypothetical protein